MTARYTYDENSNRLTKTGAQGSDAATIDDQDRVLTYNELRFDYSSNGELRSKIDPNGTTTYDYDELGNLLKIVLPDGRVIEYLTDAQNRRIEKKIDGMLVRRWIYSGTLSPSAELDAQGNVVARFVYATRPNVPDVMINGDTTYRVVTDHLGSPRLIINATTGTVVQQMDYDEFGNVLSDTNPGFQPFGFAGGLYDNDTKLVRFGARDYDPNVGRWTARDPAGFPAGLANLYSYVAADPINVVDPTGLSGTLTINSAGNTDEGGSSTSISTGHSWITYRQDGGETTTYGTYNNNPGGRGNGLVQNWEKDNPGVYLPEASRTSHISDADEARLFATIDSYRKTGWSFRSPCSRFARDAWRSATGERLRDSKYVDGQSNPTSLKVSIKEANGGQAQKTIPQR